MNDEQALTVREEDRPTSIIMDPEAAQKALDIMTKGDLSRLSTEERATFLANMAKSLGLNPLTKPVQLIKNDKGELIVYFNKGATDQLRAIHRVNLQIIDRCNPTPHTYAVTSRATMPSGRQDEDVGVVVLTPNMDPEKQANALMRAPTKSKRRVTLSILGLGALDESEFDTVQLFRDQLAQTNEPRRLAAPASATPGMPAWEEKTAVPTEARTINVETSPTGELAQAAISQPIPIPVPVAKAHVITARKLPVAAPVVLPK